MTRYRAQTNAPDPGHCVVGTVPNDPGERIVAETLTRADAEMIAAALNGRGAVEDRDALAAYLRWLTDGARGEPPMMGVDVHAMLDRIQRGQSDETAAQLDRAVNEAARRLREE